MWLEDIHVLFEYIGFSVSSLKIPMFSLGGGVNIQIYTTDMLRLYVCICIPLPGIFFCVELLFQA